MRRRYATGLAVLTGALIVLVPAVFALIPHRTMRRLPMHEGYRGAEEHRHGFARGRT